LMMKGYIHESVSPCAMLKRMEHGGCVLTVVSSTT
jgi:hypothetical protein